MKFINLLPQELQHRAAQQRVIPVYVAACLAAGVVVGALWFGSSQRITYLQRTRDMENTEIQRLQQAVNEVFAEGQLSGSTTDYAKKVAELNKLAAAEVRWPSAFAMVGSIVPKDVTISGYTLVQATSGDVQVKATGEAPSTVSFATLVATLRQDTRITGLVVDTYSFSPATGRVAFSISVSIPAQYVRYAQLKSSQ
jgi:uncharacterized protein (UPF0335 family)